MSSAKVELLRYENCLTSELNPVTGFQLPTTLGLLEAIDPDLPALNALLGFTACEDQALPFQKLIQANGLGCPQGCGHAVNSCQLHCPTLSPLLVR